MLQLDIFRGRAAGTPFTARRFPVGIGRAPDCSLRLEDDGVWEHHAEIRLHHSHEFVLTASPQTSVLINGEPTISAVLRNGDIIALGAAQLRFGLSPTRPRSLRFREVFTWVALGALCLGQIGLIYWLLG